MKRLGLLCALFALGLTAALAPVSGAQQIKLAATPGLDTHIVSQTSTTVTIGWTQTTGGLGYVLAVGPDVNHLTRVSNTWDPSVTQVRFGIKSGTNIYAVQEVLPGPSGSVQIPPVTTTTVTTTTTTTVTTIPGAIQLTPTNGTFNSAYDAAPNGGMVVVHGGNYPTDPVLQHTGINPDGSHPVTFVCAGDGNVTFTDPVFYFWAGTDGPTIQGSCFHFHTVMIGLGGYIERTQNVTLNGVAMESFSCAGCSNTTIENSTVGPFVICYAPNDGYNAPSYAYCDPNNTSDGEAYWAQHGGNSGVQGEPFIHSGGAGTDTNVTLLNDTISGLVSKWGATHIGGLLVWDSNHLIVENTTFTGNGIYNIEFNAGSQDTGDLWQNDTFGPSVYPLDAGANAGKPIPNSQCQDGMGGSGAGSSSFTNINWAQNHFVQCVFFGGPGHYSGVTVQNNVIDNNPQCPATTGITYTGNTSQGNHVCG